MDERAVVFFTQKKILLCFFFFFYLMKMFKNLLPLWHHRQKTKIKNFLIFFKIEITRLSIFSEGLNNSLAQSAAELWLTKTSPTWANHTFGVILKFVLKFWLLSHNFPNTNAGKAINSSKDSCYCLNSNKNLSQKMANWVGAQGPLTSAKYV